MLQSGELWGTVGAVQRPMLVGTYDYTLDAKNRVAIPARLRPFFAEGIYLSRGFEHSLAGRTPEEFERYLQEEVRGDSKMDRRRQGLLRYHTADAVYQELDGQGRITIPARLLQFASVAKDVTIIGVQDHIEIWERSAWDEYLRRQEEEADDIADEFATA
jgi:MraZ protein